MEIQGLDRRLDGLKILLISDIHGGSNHVTEESLDQLVKTANEQSADLMLILGDFVSLNLGRNPESIAMPIETIANHLMGLRAKYGVYAVLGNHDVAFGPDRIITALEAVKIRVLNGEILTIKTE
ncbi:MAG TPA: metallophosphoesterase, partial [Pyrinomonadaceae bacterium]|nr:metallophosphoesterase [Pyrinomonadaceae bacterium]